MSALPGGALTVSTRYKLTGSDVTPQQRVEKLTAAAQRRNKHGAVHSLSPDGTRVVFRPK